MHMFVRRRYAGSAYIIIHSMVYATYHTYNISNAERQVCVETGDLKNNTDLLLKYDICLWKDAQTVWIIQ